MMSQRLRLELVTPERLVLSEEVDEVRVPGTLGELGVLPGHTPLLTSLGTGPLSYFQGSSGRSLAVQDGFAEVLPDRVTVLARIADAPSDIDVESARAALAEAEARLPTASAEEIDELTAAVRLAATRIEVSTTSGP
jgi:F-type H+-transporting ATPase subunit epsilon